MDETLSWNYHTSQLSLKLSRSIGILAKIRHYVSPETLRLIYFALFSSHMSCGCIIWGQKGSVALSKISTLQNRATKVMCLCVLLTTMIKTKPLHSNLKILKFTDLITLENCLFVNSFMKG